MLNKNNTAFIPDSHLEISEDPLNGPIFKSKYLNQIKLLDAQYNGRGRDIFEIVNTIRASRGLKALEVPPELQTLREQKGLTKTIKANIALARAIGNGKAEEIEVDNAGLVSINRLENAFTSTNFTAFGLNPTNPNFDIILQGAGVTREQFNTDPNADTPNGSYPDPVQAVFRNISALNLNAVSQEIANDKTIGVEITRDGAAPAFVNVTIKANISAT